MPVVQGMVACDMKHKLGMVACDMRHKLGMVACDMRHKLGIVACDLMHMLMFIVWLIHYTRETPSLVPKPNILQLWMDYITAACKKGSSKMPNQYCSEGSMYVTNETSRV